jgi:hypothetical protein
MDHYLLGRYSDSYANKQFRALQQLLEWDTTEDHEESRPTRWPASSRRRSATSSFPSSDDELAALLGSYKGGGFQNRRDYGIISMFTDTGARLAELAGLTTDDLSPLDSVRRGVPVPSLARWLLGLGIAATLAANVAHGLGHGLIGAAVGAWPAVALVGSYELLMMSIRSTQLPADVTAVREASENDGPLRTQAAEEFASEVAVGRVPSVRAIRARLHVGQPRAQRVRAYLAALART